MTAAELELQARMVNEHNAAILARTSRMAKKEYFRLIGPWGAEQAAPAKKHLYAFLSKENEPFRSSSAPLFDSKRTNCYV